MSTLSATNAAPAHTPGAPERRVPRFGGFNLTFLALEVRRILRNRRTMVFVLIMPSVFFLMFGLPQKHSYVNHVSAVAYVMISLAIYGAMVATTAGGAMVSVERALGWSRQLRLTPLRPGAYMTIKVISAMVLGLLAVVVEFIVGAASGVHMAPHVWLLSGLAAWIGSLVFAAFGLFIGYLVPAENAMQFLGPILAILAMFGGLFVPLEVLPHIMQTIAKYTPVYGIGEIARAPLTGDTVTLGAVANVVLWTAVFGFGAARLFRRDTKRV